MAKLSSKQKLANADASRFAITVTFEIDNERFEVFLPLMHENAQASVREEPGCLRFDVLLPIEDSARRTVFLYEVYESRAAFDAHLASPHFLSFDEATRDMIIAKSVTIFEAFENAKPI